MENSIGRMIEPSLRISVVLLCSNFSAHLTAHVFCILRIACSCGACERRSFCFGSSLVSLHLSIDTLLCTFGDSRWTSQASLEDYETPPGKAKKGTTLGRAARDWAQYRKPIVVETRVGKELGSSSIIVDGRLSMERRGSVWKVCPLNTAVQSFLSTYVRTKTIT